MKVITTHTSADFDSLSSMIAAKKIYPDAVLVFPGSQEKSLRDFLIRSTLYALNITKIKDIDLDSVDTLILVDTRQRSRIGDFAKILKKSDLKIHIYDHHPPTDDDIKGEVEYIRNTGAAVTILVNILKERQIPISAEEATIMMLGIYEETGSFTYPSTKTDDFEAASYLLSKGANLNVVSDMLVKELTAEHVVLLNELISNATSHNINGVNVVITECMLSHYVGEVALVVHKLRDMENLNVIFALIGLEDRVFIIGRSRIPEIDVGYLLTFFGGGGHKEAGSATVKGKTTMEVKEDLIKVLKANVRVVFRAKDVMFFPVKYVEANESIDSARETMVKYGINAMPVMEEDKVVGIVTRQIAEKACFHDLGHMPVKEYMVSEIKTVKEDDPIDLVRDVLLFSNQRFLPVLRDGRLVGGITRTDLLRLVESNSNVVSEQPYLEKRRTIKHLLQERIKGDIFERLKKLGEIADTMGYRAYIVGGFVRDLLLKRENYDVDIVIEGDGIKFAKEVKRILSVKLREHVEFGTATLYYPDGFKVDVATCRVEYYKEPGSLPVVERGSLKLDLSRRDFTINTLAISINQNTFGELIDYFGGQRDIKEGTVRVLHSLSFVEDPTRILRAIRFEHRFGFKISKHTMNLIKNAVRTGFLSKVEGIRIWNELRLCLMEPTPEKIMKRLSELGVLSSIYEELLFDEKKYRLFEEIASIHRWYELLYKDKPAQKIHMYLIALIHDMPKNRMDDFMERLELGESLKSKLRSDIASLCNFKNLVSKFKDMKKSEIAKVLREMSQEAILFAMASSEDEALRKTISNYITTLSYVKPEITGVDLKAMGLKPGPIFKEILENIRDLKIDGLLKSKDDEIRYALSYINDAS
ncbi:MAG: CBS domain-containing protein [Desulfobacterota bacterium]|nr:CBS domain-containing protein [Thermodesulfobacteriota bacterium]MDW8001927.1 CBS domain-containing protein [Deltaproteobacteria bacterium]